jgi:hypothetical protein
VLKQLAGKPECPPREAGTLPMSRENPSLQRSLFRGDEDEFLCVRLLERLPLPVGAALNRAKACGAQVVGEAQ